MLTLLHACWITEQIMKKLFYLLIISLKFLALIQWHKFCFLFPKLAATTSDCNVIEKELETLQSQKRTRSMQRWRKKHFIVPSKKSQQVTVLFIFLQSTCNQHQTVGCRIMKSAVTSIRLLSNKLLWQIWEWWKGTWNDLIDTSLFQLTSQYFCLNNYIHSKEISGKTDCQSVQWTYCLYLDMLSNTIVLPYDI